MPFLSFILNKDLQPLDPQKVVRAASELGFKLAIEETERDDPEEEGPEIWAFGLADGRSMLVSHMPVPHPDVEEMSRGPLSPDNMDELINAPAHFIIVLVGEEDKSNLEPGDIEMAGLTSAVMSGCSPVGVLQMPGMLFHRPALFADAAKSAVADGKLPMLIAVDVMAAMEDEKRFSFLTRNMQRYGREELYVTASADAEGAVGFVFDMMAWLLDDREYQLPTGETVGRTADEQIHIQRVPNPTGEGPEVVKLDLP